MKSKFHVIISKIGLVFNIDFFYNTDLRWNKESTDIPIIDILQWLNNNRER